MAGVLEQLIRPRKRAVVHCTSRMNPKALELQTAKEILAEVFRVRVSEVDEMIQNRFDQARSQDDRHDEDGQWPQEFWLDG
ncbi:MAG: hypothetical protein NTY37_08815 [Methanothrix sp.]|nr:hypothetical protein [Methanothrix sp.]